MVITELSLYSTLGLIAFVTTAVIGIVLKVIFRAKRKNADGAHGFAVRKSEETVNDSWEVL